MTAHAMNGVSDEYLAAGMSDYIPKPFQPQLLLNKIQSLVTSRPRETSVPSLPGGQDITGIEAHLQSMLEILAYDQVASIVALYLQATEGHLGSISDCQAAGDIAGLMAQAHILVSLAGNVGAVQASQAARDLEHGCRDGAPAERISELVTSLASEIASSAAVLRSWKARPLEARTSA
jgi:HPt (histidine-containing phosphotransfer) domain-containing protein